MSLINDMLRDLQQRNAGQMASTRFDDLRPARSTPVRRAWLWPAAALLTAGSALAYFQADRQDGVAAPATDGLHQETVGEAPSERGAGNGSAPVEIDLPAEADVALARDERDTDAPSPAPVEAPRLASAMPASEPVAAPPPVAAERRDVPPRQVAAKSAPTPAEPAPTPVAVAAPAADAPVTVAVAPREPVAEDATPAAQVGHTDVPTAGAPAKVRATNPRGEGLAALAEGRPADALEHFRAWIARAPADAEARVYEARALAALGRQPQAEAALSASLTVVSAPAPVARALARHLLARGQTEEALTLLEVYRPRERLDAEHDAFIAAAAQRLGRHEMAAQRYRGVLAVRPEAADWWVGLAISEEARGRGEAALIAYRHARNLGNLDPRLAAYAERRIAAMQGADRS